jgi:phage terminase small subunit
MVAKKLTLTRQKRAKTTAVQSTTKTTAQATIVNDSEESHDKKLTPKQILFIAEYLTDLNGTQAAIRAGYSPTSAKAQAYENLTKPHIQNEINRQLKAKILGKDEILFRLSEMARASMGDFITVDGAGFVNFDMREAVKNGKLHLIKKITVEKGRLVVELHDAKDALVQLGRYHTLFKDKVIVDWRQEAKEAGADNEAGELFEELVERYATKQAGGA